MEKRRIHTISEASVLTTKFQQTKRTKHEKNSKCLPLSKNASEQYDELYYLFCYE